MATKKFLGAFVPPKPIDEMTDEELTAFAEAVGDAMAGAAKKVEPVKEPEAPPKEAQ